MTRCATQQGQLDQQRLSREGQITDRFTAAVEQLGSEDRAVRLGGVYALERIAHDSENDVEAVIQVLTAYVREQAPWPPRFGTATPAPDVHGHVHPEEDVQAVLTVIEQGRWAEQVVTEDGTANLSMECLDLGGTDLRGAQFRGTPLLPLCLSFANLTSADLASADLRRAVLDEADLTDANLRGADLSGADLRRAVLLRATLSDAVLTDAKLFAVTLSHAYLVKANLAGADLGSANLMGAQLAIADLTGADLTNARNLTQAQIDSASWDANRPPVLPAGITAPPAATPSGR